jgi:hypothetical protein
MAQDTQLEKIIGDINVVPGYCDAVKKAFMTNSVFPLNSLHLLLFIAPDRRMGECELLMRDIMGVYFRSLNTDEEKTYIEFKRKKKTENKLAFFCTKEQYLQILKLLHEKRDTIYEKEK